MLQITFGDVDGMLRKAARYFDANYEPEWLDDPLVKEMIKDVDKSEVISREVILSPVFDSMSPMYLSGGVKSLILMLKEPEHIFYGSLCGDNCAKWILKIGEMHDIHVSLSYLMDFGPKEETMNALILNDGTRISTVEEYIYKFAKFC